MAHQAYELLVDVWGIPERDWLHSPGQMEALMEEIRRAVGMDTLVSPLYVYATGQGKAWGPGVSGVTLITDSNLVLHTIPDDGAVHFNLFSCARFDAGLVCRMLDAAFGGKQRSRLIDRSTP